MAYNDKCFDVMILIQVKLEKIKFLLSQKTFYRIM